MVIRNRIAAFLYRLFLLGIGIFDCYLLMSFQATSGNSWNGLTYFGSDAALFATAILLAEVIANLIGLNKGAEGIAPGVWSPLFMCALVFILSDLGAYLGMGIFQSEDFFAASAGGTLLISVSKIIFPVLFYLDYLLFGEKGTVKWKHPLFWMIFPVFYFAAVMIAGSFFDGGNYPYDFFDYRTFIFSGTFLAQNGGWFGVGFFCALYLALFLLLSYWLVFFNNLFAGAYRRHEPSDL